MVEKKYFVQWADLDANWHLANFSYLKYSTDSRMYFFNSIGFTKERLLELLIGPIVFNEHIYYYKEMQLHDEFIIVNELDGYSEDGRFFRIIQNFYKDKINTTRIEILASIMNLKTRKLSEFPKDIFNNLKKIKKSKSLKIIKKGDTRVEGKLPKDFK